MAILRSEREKAIVKEIEAEMQKAEIERFRQNWNRNRLNQTSSFLDNILKRGKGNFSPADKREFDRIAKCKTAIEKSLLEKNILAEREEINARKNQEVDRKYTQEFKDFQPGRKLKNEEDLYEKIISGQKAKQPLPKQKTHTPAKSAPQKELWGAPRAAFEAARAKAEVDGKKMKAGQLANKDPRKFVVAKRKEKEERQKVENVRREAGVIFTNITSRDEGRMDPDALLVYKLLSKDTRASYRKGVEGESKVYTKLMEFRGVEGGRHGNEPKRDRALDAIRDLKFSLLNNKTLEPTEKVKRLYDHLSSEYDKRKFNIGSEFKKALKKEMDDIKKEFPKIDKPKIDKTEVVRKQKPK